MKKIMFNDAFGLTQAVLDGRKTMERRVLSQKAIEDYESLQEHCALGGGGITPFPQWVYENGYVKYNIGEIVAIAQSYKEIDAVRRKTMNAAALERLDAMLPEMGKQAGWSNKMFVKTNLMPHKMQITNIRIDKLQDISDEECIKEGIREQIKNCGYGNAMQKTVYGYVEDKGVKQRPFDANSPREAFAMLTDRISGFGTWESNPFVWVYDFELIK